MPRTNCILKTLCYGILLSASTQPNLAGQEGIEPQPFPGLENVFEVKSIATVVMAPSGREILYTLNTVDLEANESNLDIWTIRASGQGWSVPIQLTNHPGRDSSPTWRPSAETFTFLASGRGSNGGVNQPNQRTNEGRSNKLMEMNPSGGEPSEVFQHETNITSYQWSPDGNYIAFRASDNESEDTKTKKQSGRDINYEDAPQNFSHLWLFDTNENSTTRLTGGSSYTVGSFNWSPDSRQLTFSATPSDQPFDSWKSDLYLYSLDSPDTSPVQLTTNPGPDTNPYWAPDGKHIFYMGQQTDGYQVGMTRTWKIPAIGGTPEEVSPQGDMQAGRFHFTTDGSGVYFETTTGTTRGLFYMNLEDRKPVRVSPDSGVRSRFSFSENMDLSAYLSEDPTKPTEIYLANIEKNSRDQMGEELRLTNHNVDAEKFAVGKTETIQWKNSIDGNEVEGVLLFPVGWTEGDGPRATVVKIHGGPSGVYVENFQASSSGADAQRYAGDGYFVLLPNPRGSSGYGEAGLQAVVQDWGGLDFHDIMSGVDHLIGKGYAHPDSLGVMGWSYGGFMTAWTVTQTGRFKAAVAGAAITENIAMWGTQDIQHVFEAYFGGGPYEPGLWEVYQRSNPLAFIQNASTPTMIIHGENDPRVPPNQARIFYRALKANGVDTKLVWLPRTGHGPSEPGLQFERSKAQKDWMDQHIRRFKPIT